ncbi:MAG: phage tail tape measure protein [Eubacterium sp.]|nr:phage tail tape measure protein [Eubacterium sp.]
MSAKSKEMKLAIKIAGKVDKSFGSTLKSVQSQIKTVAKVSAAAVGAVATAVAGVTTAAIKTGKEFENSMSQVAATMGIDKATKDGLKNYQTLETAAKEMGESTAFTASEAAEGLNYLALAGYSADQAATALPYTLKLAGAGAMDLADASDMVTDAMSALNIEANNKNLSTFSDQLAKTASTTNTNVKQLGEAILTVGGTAANLKGGTAELNTALGILANNGIKGAEGGTHLRNMLLSLESPTDAAAKQLEKLGVNVYDAKGNLRSLNDIFSDVQKSTKGMTNQQVDGILATLFNKRDLASARAMMKAAGDDFSKIEKTISDSAGACDQMYKTQLDNLEGDLALFTSALQGLGIEVYENIGGGVREGVQLATECIGDLNKAFKKNGLQGLVGEFGSVLSKAVNYVSDLAPKLTDSAVDLITSFISGIEKSSDNIAKSATSVFSKLITGVSKIAPKLLTLAGTLLISLITALQSELPTIEKTFFQGLKQLISNALKLLPQILDVGLDFVLALADGIVSGLPQCFSIATMLITKLCGVINSELPQILQIGIQLILNLVYGILENLPQIARSAMLIINTLIQCILQNLPIILSAGIELLYALINGIMNNLDYIIQAVIAIITELITCLAQNAPLLATSAISLISALVVGLLQALPQLIAAVPQLIIALVNAFKNYDWSTLGKDIISGIKSGLLAMKDSLIATVRNIFKSIKSIFSRKITANVSASSSGGKPHASGGIFPRSTIIPTIQAAHAAGGVFTSPTVIPSINGANHLVGEAGAEAILPLNSLWNNLSNTFNPNFSVMSNRIAELANKIEGGNKGDGNDNNGDTPTIIFSPQIIIQGNADKNDVKEAVKMSQTEFERFMNEYLKKKKRIRL